MDPIRQDGPDLCSALQCNSDGAWICVQPRLPTVGAGRLSAIGLVQTVKVGQLIGEYDRAAYLGRHALPLARVCAPWL